MFGQFIILKLLIIKKHYNFIMNNDCSQYYRYEYI